MDDDGDHDGGDGDDDDDGDDDHGHDHEAEVELECEFEVEVDDEGDVDGVKGHVKVKNWQHCCGGNPSQELSGKYCLLQLQADRQTQKKKRKPSKSPLVLQIVQADRNGLPTGLFHGNILAPFFGMRFLESLSRAFFVRGTLTRTY